MNLKEKIGNLPHEPGVYRYLDDTGTIIYVGKAKDLRKRVTQYFRPKDQLDRKTQALVEHIDDLQYTVVETEEDALLLENNLIKQLQPHYNILLKDDKTYPWISVRNERFPKVVMTRRYVQDGSRYYGPYASVQRAHGLLNLFANIYKLRVCLHPLSEEVVASKKIRPCLNYHLGRCGGPCVGEVSEEEYNVQIEEIEKILSGRTRSVISACREKMMEASSSLKFEEAQEWKQRLQLLEDHHEQEKRSGHGIVDMETFRLLKPKELPRREEKAAKVLDQLKNDLGMNKVPHHIECFDNSNIQGTNPVAACVVFKDALPSKKDYRHFLIKTVIGANDYASMKEVVNRRYSRLLSEGESLPQLVVIDGGKGQLRFALEALEELGIREQIFVVGLAERLEELIVPGDPTPLWLDKNSSSLRILMHIRDEAHRFGITHHRARRTAAQVQSELRSIKGIGEETEKKLLRKFKSVKRIREASLEDLAKVVGPSLSKIIKSEL